MSAHSHSEGDHQEDDLKASMGERTNKPDNMPSPEPPVSGEQQPRLCPCADVSNDEMCTDATALSPSALSLGPSACLLEQQQDEVDRETQAQQFPTSPDDKKHGTDQRKDPQPCKESVSTPEPFPHRQRTQAEDVWKKDDLHQSSDPPLLTFTPEVEMETCYPRTQSPHGDQAVEITPRANSLHGASSKETHNTTMVENGDNEEIEEHCLPLRRHPVARRQSMTLVLSACHTAPPPLKPVSQAKGLGNSSGFNPRILYFDQNHYDRILMPPPKSTVSLFRKSRQLQMRRALDEANSAAGQNSTTHVTRVSQPADPKPRSHCGKRCRWARDGYESDEDEGTPRMRKRRRRCGSIFGATNRQLIRRHRRSSMSLLGRLLSIDWWKNMLFNFFSTGGGRQASDGSCSRERHD